MKDFSEKKILIASASDDAHSYEPVQEILETSGFCPIVYKTDKVLSGEEIFKVKVTKNGEYSASYNNISINPDEILAGWYRKVANFAITDVESNLSKQLYMNNEMKALHSTIWPLYPEDMWLNSPDNITKGERKLKQLMVAKQVGFAVLETLVTNDWDEIRQLLPEGPQGRVAAKMMRGVIAEKDQIRSFHTTPLDKKKIDQLQPITVPYPGLFQPFINKSREWRITTVGEDVFSAAIYTDATAKDDWRKLQMTPAVVFKDEKIPDEIADKCIKYNSAMGLQYGAFDFVEEEDGKITFLECNPNGQYGWLEDTLGLQISQSIASRLMKIGKDRIAE